ncbi:hypothetical protein CEUSTIGMA_g6253.t1 [Chlamydomonas eustigma]|uniref:Uncharacterized protein n=1 Tax=Chlamydomonas eustigma TaxID=1157962 RepID=A0A250X6Z3_9CHLO|nr:hypothetical protein CEUSTIGMA_g6253.t1 [Chlamydomonas eustigma]|eukprot:GAX78816.1 hypothetical protein CEUSTIGMA_g6253.t1 [Chlamydomonas eustigma]
MRGPMACRADKYNTPMIGWDESKHMSWGWRSGDGRLPRLGDKVESGTLMLVMQKADQRSLGGSSPLKVLQKVQHADESCLLTVTQLCEEVE